jgi:hypothetical protein
MINLRVNVAARSVFMPLLRSCYKQTSSLNHSVHENVNGVVTIDMLGLEHPHP